MSAKRRYHPAILLFKLGTTIRNMFFIFLILFVFQSGSSSVFVIYGRYAFIAVIAWSVVSIALNWLTATYELDEERFHLQSGVFNKTERTIPFSKVQNINRHTSFFHKLLGLTSIHFETGMAGEDASVKFEVATKKEAARLEAMAGAQRGPIRQDPMILSKKSVDAIAEEPPAHPKIHEDRTIHFQPTTRDLLKASMTSFSFLLLVPLLASLYHNVSEFIKLEERMSGFAGSIMSSPWTIAAVALLLIAASLGFGILHTFKKYGKYEIASDSQRIYIRKGIFSEASFSIAKDRVQAIEVTQSLPKRILGLAEVRLISAGNLSMGSADLDISSLFPFLPKAKAYALVGELLPNYQIQDKMERLPRRSFWVRMLKPSWLWLIATAALFYFKPNFFSIDNTWWMASLLLLGLVLASRVLDFLQTRYCLNGELIQFKTGGFTASLFVTKREKIVEVKITQNRIQRKLGLSSLQTTTRARPVHNSYLEDVPQSLSSVFRDWYRGRSKEVEIESMN